MEKPSVAASLRQSDASVILFVPFLILGAQATHRCGDPHRHRIPGDHIGAVAAVYLRSPSAPRPTPF